MSSDLDLAGIGIAFDSTGLEAGQRAFQATEQAANRTADAVGRAQQSFTDSSARVTASARAMNSSIDGLTLGQVAFIEKLREQAATVGMSREQLLSYQAAQLGVTQQTKDLIAQIQAASKATDGHSISMGSAMAKVEAMRVVHDAMIGAYTRMTSALFVLANATGLMTAMLTPAGLGWAALAVGVGAMIVAAIQGGKELTNLNNALAVTSNYAGTTRFDMENLAKSITQSKEVTIGAANGIVMALTASGKIGGDSIAIIGRMIGDFAKATDQDISKVAPKMISLFEDPIKGANELNSSMHFLTATQMEHIAQLQRTGDIQKAQSVLAEELSQHMPKQAENLGIVTKALHEQRDAWSQVWQAMKDYGKQEDTSAKAQAQKVRDEISELLTKGYSRQSPEIRYWQDVLDKMEPAVAAQEKMTQAEKDAAAANKLQADSWDAVKASSTAYHAQELQDRLKLLQQFKPEDSDQATYKADAIRKTQQEIDDAYRSMSSIDRQLYAQQQANILSIAEIRNKSQEDDIAAQLKMGKMTQDDYDAQMTGLQLETNYAKQAYEEAMLHVSNLSATEKQAHKLKLDMLREEASAIQQAGANAAAVSAWKIQSDSDDAMNKYIDSLQKEAQQLENTNAQHDKSRDVIERETVARLDNAIALQHELMLQQSKNGATAKELDQAQTVLSNLEAQRAAHERIAKALDQADVIAAHKKATEEAARAWKNLSDTIETDLTNAILDGGGKGWKKLVRDMEVAFAKLVLQPILQPISAGIASFVNPGAPQAVAFGGGSAGGVGGLINAANAASSVYKAGSLGVAGLFNSAGGMIASAGNMVGSSSLSAFGAGFAGDATAGWGYGSAAQGFANLGMTSEATAAGYGSMAATGVGVGAGVLGGVYGGRAISGGYGSNGAVNTGTAVGAAVGSIVPVIGTAIGALVGGLMGGVYNRLFGHQAPSITSQGISGSFSDGAITGQTYQKITEKGGWFTSDKNYTNSQTLAGTDLQKQLTEGFKTLTSLTSGFAKSVGASVDSLAGYSKQFDIITTGDATKDQKALTDFFNTVSDEIARKLVPNIDDFTKSGETAAAALQRLAGEFQATDAVAQSLGKTAVEAFGSVGMESAKARENLINLAGGIQTLTAQAQSFAQNYLTDAERLAPVQKAVDTAMAAMGLQAIKTRDQFKQVVLGLDLTTDAGAKEYTQLMAIADAFAQVHPQIDATASAVDSLSAAQKSLLDAVTSAQNDVQTAYDRESKALSDLVTKFTDLGKSIRKFNDGLVTGSLSPLSPTDQYNTLKGQFDKTYTMAMAGDPDAMSSLQDVAQQFLTASKSYYGANEKYAADFDKVRSALSNAANSADQQAAIAQSQLSVMQQQAASILDLNKTMLSFKDAVTKYFAARLAALNGGVPASALPGDPNAQGIAAIGNATQAYGDKYGSDAYYLMDGVNDFQAKFDTAHMLGQKFGKSDSDMMAQLFGHTMDYWANVQAQFTAGKHPTASGDIADSTSAQSQTAVQSLYQQILGRPADAGGLSFWSAQLDAGVSPDTVRQALLSSVEANGSHASGLDRVPRDGYRAVLHAGERVQTKAQADSNDEMVGLLKTMITELRADKTQRGAVAQATIDKLQSVADGVDKTNRTLRAKA